MVFKKGVNPFAKKGAKGKKKAKKSAKGKKLPPWLQGGGKMGGKGKMPGCK